MSLKFQDNSAIVKAAITTKIPIFLRGILDDVDKTAQPNTPKKTGDLRNLTFKQVLGPHAEIQWRRSYAAAQEAGTVKGHPITHYSTPGTGPNFAENAVKEVLGRADQHLKEARL